MGRPLNKRYFGKTANDLVGDDLSSEVRLNAYVKVGTNAASTLGVLLQQKTETKFKVNDAADLSGNEGICTLVDKTFDNLADNEMILEGYIVASNPTPPPGLNGIGGDAVNIRKVHNRTMIDFNNNTYTWFIDDDSTANILRLVAI